MKKFLTLTLLCASASALTGCRQDMRDQEKYEPLEHSDFFGDKLSSRQIPSNTVARGFLKLDLHYWEGMGPDGKFSNELPPAITEGKTLTQILERGQNRFNIYCSPCHDKSGTGTGMIVRRGYKQPPSFHDQRLREQPIGYFFNVITHGFAVMPDYAAQIKPEDRWAVAAYMRALQYTQQASLEDVPEDHRKDLVD